MCSSTDFHFLLDNFNIKIDTLGYIEPLIAKFEFEKSVIGILQMWPA